MYFLSLFYLQVCWNISYNNQLIEDRTSYEFKISSERISSFPSVITRLVHLNLEHSVSPQEIWGRGGVVVNSITNAWFFFIFCIWWKYVFVPHESSVLC